MPLLKKSFLKSKKSEATFKSPLLVGDTFNHLRDTYKNSFASNKSTNSHKQKSVDLQELSNNFSKISKYDNEESASLKSFDQLKRENSMVVTTKIELSSTTNEDMPNYENCYSSSFENLLDECVKTNLQLSEHMSTDDSVKTISSADLFNSNKNQECNDRSHGEISDQSMADALDEIVNLNIILSQTLQTEIDDVRVTNREKKITNCENANENYSANKNKNIVYSKSMTEIKISKNKRLSKESSNEKLRNDAKKCSKPIKDSNKKNNLKEYLTKEQLNHSENRNKHAQKKNEKKKNKVIANSIQKKKNYKPKPLKKITSVSDNSKQIEEDVDELLRLQTKYDVGLYVYCDRCDKVRYLPNCKDPLELPDKWYCNMNPDVNYSSCNDPDYIIDPETEDLLIKNKYNAGSLVWAKMQGYPWWPAMVDDDPDLKQYFWLDDEESKEPSWYHVTFFDSSAGVTRAWIKTTNLVPFFVNAKNKTLKPKKCNVYKRALKYSVDEALKAHKLSIRERLGKYSFLERYFIQQSAKLVEIKKRKRVINNTKPKSSNKMKKLKGNEGENAIENETCETIDLIMA